MTVARGVKRLPVWLTLLTVAALPCSITVMNIGLGLSTLALLWTASAPTSHR